MSKHGKKYRKKKELVEPTKRYPIDDAFKMITDLSYTKFDESVDLAIRLGVDPKHSEQMVRGAVNLPHGTGKKVRVVVFARGEKVQEAENAGADFVGGDELVEKIKGGWLDFDSVVASPDMMAVVSKIGKLLGPKGLMPNPKTGTVTQDVAKAVKEVKAGKVEFRVEKAGVVHVPIGKVSFGGEKLKGNFLAIMESIQKAKPTGLKNKYYRSVALSTTMSPAVKIDVSEYEVGVGEGE